MRNKKNNAEISASVKISNATCYIVVCMLFNTFFADGEDRYVMDNLVNSMFFCISWFSDVHLAKYYVLVGDNLYSKKKNNRKGEIQV